MATFNINGYDSYSGCDILVTARLNNITGLKEQQEEKVYTLGSLQTLSISTHQEKRAVRVIGSMNALDYTMGQRTIGGSLVFAVFDKHFASEMFADLERYTGKTFFLPDELPALDLTITFANEYGRTSRMAVYGVRIINEGQVMSVNDLYTENTYQFIANALEPLRINDGENNNSNNNNQIALSSISDLNLNNNEMLLPSNDILFNYTQDSNLKRVLLSVDIEQPLYKGIEGICRFSLTPNQESGVIKIINQMNRNIVKQVQVSKNNTNHIAFLSEGFYEAWFENNDKILSNTLILAINVINNNVVNFNDTPIIEHVTHDTISIYSNNISHLTAVIGLVNENNITNIQEIELNSRRGTFKNLLPNTKYRIYTKNDTSVSLYTDVFTLQYNNSYTEDFKQYIKNNKSILNKDIDSYSTILNSLTNEEDFIFTLKDIANNNEDLSDLTREIIFLAIKYKNEFIQICNSNIYENIPKKDLSNLYGNLINLNEAMKKTNVYYIKNNKEYYENSYNYSSQINHEGKSNTLYNVIAIDENSVKTPKYYLYNYSDNDKHKIFNIFGQHNILSTIELTQYNTFAARKHNENALKCLAVKNNKIININLLKAPYGEMLENNTLKVRFNYSHLINGGNYYLVIANINEALDVTGFRKIAFNNVDQELILSSYHTAINSIDTFCLWIEDEYHNIISDLGFVSYDESINELNEFLFKDKFTVIYNNLNKQFGIEKDIFYDIYLNEECDFNDIYLNIAQVLIDNDKDIYILQTLFNLMFKDFYINQEKYRIINKNNNTYEFLNAESIICINFKKQGIYDIEKINTNQFELNKEYDYSIYYVIDSNTNMKSGYMLTNNKDKVLTYNIEIKEA